MSVDRAVEETPERLTRTTPRRWFAGLRRRIQETASSRVALLNGTPGDETDPELANLWLMLLASDPDGVWYSWPTTASGRPQLEDPESKT
jgi:hypothetical protein